ncbi:16S rRNA processing protein RimM [Panacibacter sp. KCS-6]|jgi:16S rRNA processing protein RimM|uniref:Ribosome maturation factor RimM n=2 Tax=Limnovirga soli TaxID=2656915 RepID=A0A8J8FCV8_9BACT|nr:16S rRNA processing protein RimM [Limnovirga soli]
MLHANKHLVLQPMSDYINIGKLAAVFGVTGELILKHALGKKISFKPGEAIFVEEKKDAYLPYFVTSAKAKTEDETILQIEDIDSREKAMILLRKQVWLPQEDFRKMVAKNSPIGLLGYTILEEGTALGIIEEVIEQPHQVLLSFIKEEKEVLIPLHDATLVNIDHKKKEVHVVLPDGLLDVYLNV